MTPSNEPEKRDQQKAVGKKSKRFLKSSLAPVKIVTSWKRKLKRKRHSQDSSLLPAETPSQSTSTTPRSSLSRRNSIVSTPVHFYGASPEEENTRPGSKLAQWCQREGVQSTEVLTDEPSLDEPCEKTSSVMTQSVDGDGRVFHVVNDETLNQKVCQGNRQSKEVLQPKEDATSSTSNPPRSSDNDDLFPSGSTIRVVFTASKGPADASDHCVCRTARNDSLRQTFTEGMDGEDAWSRYLDEQFSGRPLSI